MRKYVLLSSVLCQEDEFCFGSVCCVSVEITASSNPSFTLSSLVSSRNKSHFTRVIDPCVSEVNHNKPRNKASNPFVCFDLNEIIDPIAVIHIAESLVFHRTISVNEGLQGIGQVVLVAEVKIFAGKHLLQPFNVDLVFRGLLMSQAEELDFLNLEYFSVINLSDD